MRPNRSFMNTEKKSRILHLVHAIQSFLESNSDRNNGVELTAGELLDRGRQRLATRDDLDPLLQADLLGHLEA